jgi:hypothetical protein
LSLGGVIPGTAAAVAPAAATAGDVATIPVALAAVARPVAVAAPMSGDDGEFDVFNNADFQGGFADLTKSTIPDLSVVGLNDLISSAVNNSDIKMCLFTDADFGGQMIPFPPHTQLQQFDANQSDQVSSVRPC